MASPAATAAYLMESSVWDSSAEEYLKSVVDRLRSDGGGTAPSAFPSTFFELTWSMSTLLKGQVIPKEVCCESLSVIKRFLEVELSNGPGVIGFAPGVLEDADDTAKTILTLTLLESDIDPGPMLERFRTRDCFMTYVGESDPSFSANCNILIAMLHRPSLDSLEDPIEMATTFLCRTWLQGNVKDKWNLSPYYSMMLLAQCLAALLVRWNQGHLKALPDLLVRSEAPLIMVQIATELLQSQYLEGS
ncbi:hypothetical protein MMC34_002423 [Xylographa carneopallida]|nr:hypothetical protein [Xylographa carneopallida]